MTGSRHNWKRMTGWVYGGVVVPGLVVGVVVSVVVGAAMTDVRAAAQDTFTFTPYNGTAGTTLTGYPGAQTADAVVVLTVTGPDALYAPTSGPEIAITGSAANYVSEDSNVTPSCFSKFNGSAVFPPFTCAFGVYFYPVPATQQTYTATVTLNYVDGATNKAGTQAFTLTLNDSSTPGPSGTPNLSFVPLTTRFAGTGSGAPSSVGKTATTTSFIGPVDMVFDSQGNAYIADSGNYVVWKVTPAGAVTAYAGTPEKGGINYGYSGEGGAATSATLYSPGALAIDSAGNLYIGDNGDAVRKVTPTGTISTIAGVQNGYTYGYSGDGGAATSALFYKIVSICLDTAGNMYLLEQGSNDIRKIDTTGKVSTYAGENSFYNQVSTYTPHPQGFSGDGGPAASATFYHPNGLAIDANNNLYVADGDDDRIRKINATTTVITTVAGIGASASNETSTQTVTEGFPALQAEFFAGAVALDPSGNIFIEGGIPQANVGGQVYRVDATTGSITNYPSTNRNPYAAYLRFDASGNLYELDQITSTIYEVSAQGTLAFGNVNLGQTSAVQYLTLQNSSSEPLSFNTTPYTVAGAFAVGSGGTCSFSAALAAGANCTVAVTFAPTIPGAQTGTISFASNSGSSPLVANLSGYGVGTGAPAVSFNPTSVGFGSQTVGTTSSGTVVAITNSGTATLTIGSIGLTGTNAGAFTDSSACGATLAVNASCNVSVYFSPATATGYSASLSVTDNATGSPQSVPLTGTGMAAALPTLTPASQYFGQGAVGGGLGTFHFLLTNNSTTTTMTNIVISVTGANAGDFRFSSNPACPGTSSLAPGASCDFGMNFYPGAVGARTATLTVSQSETATPLTSALSGNGLLPNATQLEFIPAQLNAVAGTGKTAAGCAITGLGGPATSATLCSPYAANMDSYGNTYIVDSTANEVLKIDTSGNLTVFAGGGTGGLGDGGPATSATLNQPVAVVADGSGNVYIADSGNNRIREVAYGGSTITTFLGGGTGQYYVDGQTGTGVTLTAPGGMAFDYSQNYGDEANSGDMYLADTGAQIVLRVTPGGLATRVAGVTSAAGPGTAGYNGDNIPANTAYLNNPQQVAVDKSGQVYVADTKNYRVRLIDPVAGGITTVAGTGVQGDTGDGGPATSAQIGAVGVAASSGYYVYITDGATVRQFVAGGTITTIAGGGAGPALGPVGGSAIGAHLASGLLGVDNAGDVLISDPSSTPQVFAVGTTGVLVFPSQALNTTSSPLTITLNDVGGDSQGLNFTEGSTTYPQVNFVATGDFKMTGNNCQGSDGGAANCTMTVTFTPTASGARTGSITAMYAAYINGGSEVYNTSTILLQGTGATTTPPSATLTPSPYSFGSVAANTSASETLTLTNTGTVAFPVSSYGIQTLTGAAAIYSVTGTTCGASLAAGATCTFTVSYLPATTGVSGATFFVTDATDSITVTDVLSGTGTAAAKPTATLTPSPYNFGSVTVNSTVSVTLTLTNTGTVIFPISSYALQAQTGAAATYSVTASFCGYTLAPGGSCNFTVSYTPTATGSSTDTFAVNDSADSVTVTDVLSGTGAAAAAPVATLTPATLAFPNTTQGQTATALMTVLSNTGNATLTITGLSLTGAGAADFALGTTTCGATLAAGTSCSIAATFTPLGTQSYSAAISVADNAAGSPQTATLTGTGLAVVVADFGVSSTTGPQAVNPGASAQYNILVSTTGGSYTGSVTLAATGLPPGATATFSPAAVSPGSSSAGSVLTVQTAPGVVRNRLPAGPWVPSGITLALALPLLWWRKRKLLAGRVTRLLSMTLMAGLLAAVAGLAGCGAGFPKFTSPQTYTITVTGSGATTTHSTTVTLTVQ